MKPKNLSCFYNNFYKSNFYRDFRAVNDILKPKVKVFGANKLNGFKQIKLFKWIANINKKCNRSLYSEVYPSGNIEEYQNKLNSRNKLIVNKIYDRLYFDFDFNNNPVAKELKKSIIMAIANNDTNLLKELREKYQYLLLNEKLAIDSYNDTLKFHNYLSNHEINSYICFSGSKGFHLFIFYPETTEFKDKIISNVSLAYAKTYKENLNLKTMDIAVNTDAYARVHRIPYTKHLITGLYCYPIDIEDDYTSIIEKAIKPDVTNFKIQDYQNHETFTKELLKLSKLLEKKKLEELETKKRLNQIRLSKNKNFKTDIDLTNIDCRTLANKVLGSPEYTNGNLNRYNCCFHSDKNPSLSVYQDRFICGACGIILNYYDFIAKYFNLSDSKEIIKKLMEIY